MVVGLIADTHGLIREAALRALDGVDVILHAGDVGRRSVLDALAALAPVHAVFGNVDLPDGTLQASIDREFEGVRLHVSHGHEIGSPTPERLVERYDADVIVYGHTHRALVKQVRSTLVINPGAAGPARFNLKPSIARLQLPERDARIIALEP
jgi:putative phosphoesterase